VEGEGVKTKSLFNLKNKVAVVTGGYGHLGKHLCLGLAEEGAYVFAAGPSKSKFNRAFMKDKSPLVYFESMDVSCEESIKTAFKSVFKRKKRIDILVNNAIYSKGNDPIDLNQKDWNHSIDGVLNSVFRCIKAVVPYMKKTKEASIINIASMYGIISPDFSVYEGFKEQFSPPHYGAAKAGVIQLSRYFAVYLAQYGIRVNCISPGAFPKPKVTEKFVKKLEKKIPMGRTGKPEELKGAIQFLASGASSYMTGQNMIIDGGWTLC